MLRSLPSLSQSFASVKFNKKTCYVFNFRSLKEENAQWPHCTARCGEELLLNWGMTIMMDVQAEPCKSSQIICLKGMNRGVLSQATQGHYIPVCTWCASFSPSRNRTLIVIKIFVLVLLESPSLLLLEGNIASCFFFCFFLLHYI